MNILVTLAWVIGASILILVALAVAIPVLGLYWMSGGFSPDVQYDVTVRIAFDYRGRQYQNVQNVHCDVQDHPGEGTILGGSRTSSNWEVPQFRLHDGKMLYIARFWACRYKPEDKIPPEGTVVGLIPIVENSRRVGSRDRLQKGDIAVGGQALLLDSYSLPTMAERTSLYKIGRTGALDIDNLVMELEIGPYEEESQIPSDNGPIIIGTDEYLEASDLEKQKLRDRMSGLWVRASHLGTIDDISRCEFGEAQNGTAWVALERGNKCGRHSEERRGVALGSDGSTVTVDLDDSDPEVQAVFLSNDLIRNAGIGRLVKRSETLTQFEWYARICARDECFDTEATTYKGFSNYYYNTNTGELISIHFMFESLRNMF